MNDTVNPASPASTAPAWSSHLDEQKRGLARLLARENITVRHDNVATAMFNIQTRELLLPKWTGITVDQYDLLIGHEVGHALYTDKARLDLLKSSKAFHSYVNVLEDTRIERRIKEAFPGLRGSFLRGYKDFATNGPLFKDLKPMDEYSFIDRINLHYKIGAHVTVPFSPEEIAILKRIDTLRTFEEVVAMARELWDRAKTEQQKQDKEKRKGGKTDPNAPKSTGDSSDDDSDSDGEGDESENDASGSSSKKSSKKSSKTSKPSKSSKSQSDTGDDTDDAAEGQNDDQQGDESGDASNADGDGADDKGASSSNASESAEPKGAETDAANEDAMKKMGEDAMAAKGTPVHQVNYTTVPADALRHMVIASTTFTTDAMNALRVSTTDTALAQSYLASFKSKYDPMIAHMAREFDRRKSAKLHEHARQARTGRLDVTKLASYKFREDLFQSLTILPNGKSHGVMVLVDGSGSMRDVMSDVLDQAMVFAQFARRVNVPCQVFLFRQATYDRYYDRTGVADNANAKMTANIEQSLQTAGAHALVPVSSTRLTTLIDTTSKANWKTQELCIAALASFYSPNVYDPNTGRASSRVSTTLPHTSLTNTPLESGLLLVEPLLAHMKTSLKLDKTTVVVLTDGEDNVGVGVVNGADITSPEYLDGRYGALRSATIVRDVRTRKVYNFLYDTPQWDRATNTEKLVAASAENTMGRAITDMLRTRYSARVVVMRLLDKRDVRRAGADGSVVSSCGELLTDANYDTTSPNYVAGKKTMAAVKELGVGVLSAPHTYYDALIAVSTSALDLDAKDVKGADASVASGASTRAIKTTFTKQNVNAMRNRVFVNAIVPFLA